MALLTESQCKCCNCNLNKKIDEGNLDGVNKVDFHCIRCIAMGVND